MATQHGSWAHYPITYQTATSCSWRSELERDFARVVREYGQTLPYGKGRSYGDSCHSASGHVLAMPSMSKFVCANWDTGIVRVESGMTLDELLKVSVPKGWFLPVSPGTKFVTLGGAVANDVHGKNHCLRGSFGNHIRSLGLTRSDEGRLVCSQAENSTYFYATIGGLGLSGVIEWVEMQLVRIRSSRMNCRIQRFENLSEFFSLASEFCMQSEYAAAWVDCNSSGASIGRGVYTIADHAEDGSLKYEKPGYLSVPFTPPFSLINSVSLALFNKAYWNSKPVGSKLVDTSYESLLYPLDRILEWNRVYGPSGFQQYQCVVPSSDAQAAIQAILGEISASGLGSFLSVLKTFGEVQSLGLLSFPMPGTTLALDFPNKKDPVVLKKLFDRLDAIVVEAGGRLYPAKDAHMTGVDFRRFFPRWEQVEALRDPKLCSRFWQRVCLRD